MLEYTRVHNRGALRNYIGGGGYCDIGRGGGAPIFFCQTPIFFCPPPPKKNKKIIEMSNYGINNMHYAIIDSYNFLIFLCRYLFLFRYITVYKNEGSTIVSRDAMLSLSKEIIMLYLTRF